MVIDCRECHGKVSTEAKACPHCGAPTTAMPAAPAASAAPHADVRPERRSRSIRDLLALLLAALAVIGVGVWFVMPPSGRQVAGQIAANVVRAEQTITDETFDLPAGSYRRLTLRLPREAKVTVRATVESGSAIDLYLMDPPQFGEFESAMKKVLRGEFHYKQALSRESARDYSDSAVLPPGEWSFVLKSNDPPPLLGRGAVSKVHLKVTTQN